MSVLFHDSSQRLVSSVVACVAGAPEGSIRRRSNVVGRAGVAAPSLRGRTPTYHGTTSMSVDVAAVTARPPSSHTSAATDNFHGPRKSGRSEGCVAAVAFAGDLILSNSPSGIVQFPRPVSSSTTWPLGPRGFSDLAPTSPTTGALRSVAASPKVHSFHFAGAKRAGSTRADSAAVNPAPGRPNR